MASLLSFSLFSFFIISATLTAAATSTTTIKVTLSPLPHHPSSDRYQILNNLVTSSVSRAHHLKHPHPKTKAKAETNTTVSSSLIKTPIYPHSYGGYTINLEFGTPPQSLSFIMDTGSSLTWFPCTSRYLCSECVFPNVDPKKIPTFMPKLSSSTKIVGCQNPKCSLLFGPNVESRCEDCAPGTKNCTQRCPPYIIQYGLGATAGLLLVENLVFPHKTFDDFLVGCSILSNRQPAGIAGFGRSSESLPTQLGLKKFSYCLVSRRFDDTGISSNMVLETGSDSGDAKTPGLSYTPFFKNEVSTRPVFKEFYYVILRKILVGDAHVKVPYSFLVPGSDGNGGTIVDSGSTFTFMERPVYEPVAKEFEKQMGNYSRAKEVETKSGLGPCFNISGRKSINVPELIFKFKGGAKMALPLANYFSFVGEDDVVCLMIVTDNVVGQSVHGGPAIILGNFQQQNYYI
ncbi:Peptidase A1, partial [Corchorus capsularis]